MHIESLEGRRHFDVTVTEGYPGFYEVRATDADDVIEISVSQANETFTVDGVTYNYVCYIYVDGGGGNDNISVLSEDGPGSIGATIEGRGGSDTILLNFDGAIWGGDDDDIIYLSDSYNGEAYGEDGSDQIYVSGDSFGAFIRGGNGGDYIDATANNDGVTLHGDNGSDTIQGSEYDDHIQGENGTDVLYGNGGNDVFCVRDGERDEIHGGSGTDVAYADSNDDGDFDVEWILVG